MDLLIGATGTVGRSVLARYKGRDDVRIFVRTERSEDLARKEGFGNIVRGTHDDQKAVAQAFQKITRLFLLTPPSLNQPEVELRFLQAAKEHGVKRIVYISLQYTGSQPNIKITALHEPAEEWLKSSGISYVALQPPSYMDNLLGQVELIKQGQIVYAGVGEGKIAHIDTRDLADVAVSAMTDENFRGSLPVTSRRAVTFGEIAEELTRQLKRDVHLIQPPAAEWKKGLLASGMPEWYADALVEGMSYYSTMPPIVAPEPIRKARGQEPRTLEDFIAEKIVPLVKQA